MIKLTNVHSPLLIAIFCLLIGGCQTVPLKYDELQQGHFKGRVLVKDKEHQKSQVLYMDISADRLGNLKLDILSPMGGPLASFLIKGDHIQYMLIEEKKYFEGALKKTALKPVLAAPLDPRYLFNMVFDSEIKDSGWSCSKDKSGSIDKCENSIERLTLSWRNRSGFKKMIEVDHPKVMTQFYFSDFQAAIDKPEKVFSLPKPKNFQYIILP